MSVCRAFATTPDVALRLLAPSTRPLTRACLDAERAERVVAEFRQMQVATDEEKAAIAGRWKRAGDGEYLKELLRAAGRAQPGMGEV